MKTIIIVVVFITFDITAEKLDTKKDKKNTDGIDMRGTLREQFGLVASLKKINTNSVCSPISALLPLGSVALGAEGFSLYELKKAIGVDDDDADGDDDEEKLLIKHLSGLMKDLEDLRGVTLDVANRLYASNTRKLNTKYAEAADNVLKTTIETVDFNDPPSVVDIINDWVVLKTHGRVPDLLSPQSLSSTSSLVIVNAIFFAGKWKTAFENMAVGTFFSPGGPREVDTMGSIENYKYGASTELRAKLLEIPYVGQECSFLIVYPDEESGLERLLNQLKMKPELLDQAKQEMLPEYVNLTMPKFKIESEWNLTALYMDIGLSSIFASDTTELTGIIRNEKIHISEAIQKAVIEVNELGTKAAVAYAAILHPTALLTPLEFNVNHPFLFYVIANSQQLFTGTYT